MSLGQDRLSVEVTLCLSSKAGDGYDYAANDTAE